MPVRWGRFRRFVLCVVLEFAVFLGVPMRPDEVVRLMQSLSRPRVARADPDDEGASGPNGPDQE
jgi:hypothetical protein